MTAPVHTVDSHPRPVCVVWEDIKVVDSSTWVHHEDVEADFKWKPFLVKTLAFLIFDGPEGIVLSSDWSTELIGPRVQIPRGCIREMHFLDKPPEDVNAALPNPESASRRRSRPAAKKKV